MTKLNDRLVLVGGYDVSTGKVAKTAAVYCPSERSWKQPYPPMNTPRYYPAVSTYHQRLVVADGCDASYTDLAIQWKSSTYLSAIVSGSLPHHFRWDAV